MFNIVFIGTNSLKITLDTQSRLSNIKSLTGHGGTFYLDAPEVLLHITTVTVS